MPRPIYTHAVRSPSRPRGKWHLLTHPTATRTICDERARGWDTSDTSDLAPGDLCTKCLRQTP
jgi:hypothetical protein